MISLTADSTPVMSYAKTIIRLAVDARLPSWLSPHRPHDRGTHALPSRPSKIAYAGARSSYSYWDDGLYALVLRWTTVSRQGSR